jgi:hypothetical protein
MRKSALVAIASLMFTGCGAGESEPEVGISADEARAIAAEAFVYGFPAVMGYKTMYSYIVDTESPEYKGGFNELGCEARLFTPDDTAIVTPNADTPYCMGWWDLRAEPLVLTVPAMEPDRYYSFQLIDLYTHNFAYVGTLTTGNDAGTFLIAGPGWDGEALVEFDGVIRSETDLIFNITRTQLFNPDDLVRVEAIMDDYTLQPLSAFLGTEAPAELPMPEFPTWVEGVQFDERLFAYLDFMTDIMGEPLDGEAATWEQLARIGIGPGVDFDLESLPEEIRIALVDGARDGYEQIGQFALEVTQDPLASGKAFGTREFLQQSAVENFGLETPYLVRATAAQMGLYGNSAAEAIYPTYLTNAEGSGFDASTSDYTLTFTADQKPPVKSFWSLTMYDGGTQLFVRNPLDRYLLNSTMLDDFTYNDDGSLVLHISTTSPGAELENNWLPAPDGPFYMVLRLYGPEDVALEGMWTPPALVQVGR